MRDYLKTSFNQFGKEKKVEDDKNRRFEKVVFRIDSQP